MFRINDKDIMKILELWMLLGLVVWVTMFVENTLIIDILHKWLQLDYSMRLAITLIVIAPFIEELVKATAEYSMRWSMWRSASVPIMFTFWEALGYGTSWFGTLIWVIVFLRMMLIAHIAFWYIRWRYGFNIYSILATIALHALWNFGAFNSMSGYQAWMLLPISALIIMLLIAKYKISITKLYRVFRKVAIDEVE